MKPCAALVLLLALAGCGGGGSTSNSTTQSAQASARWPAPPDPMGRTRAAGLTPETHEFVFLHVHSHLDVFVNGKPVTIPAGIGIAIDDPAVRRFQAPDGSIGYGGISPPCNKPCISPLHTHFEDGVLHTEAKEHEFNKLGQFFTEWNVRLDRNCVDGFCRPTTPIAVYVDGDRFSGDPREIQLEDRQEIAIVIGRPPDTIPSSFGR
jgi:hypothetical protein